MHSLTQQINLYTYEFDLLKENIKDSVWMFNREVSDSLIRLKKPSQENQYIAESFLLTLNQKEISWKAFQVSFTQKRTPSLLNKGNFKKL